MKVFKKTCVIFYKLDELKILEAPVEALNIMANVKFLRHLKPDISIDKFKVRKKILALYAISCSMLRGTRGSRANVRPFHPLSSDWLDELQA